MLGMHISAELSVYMNNVQSAENTIRIICNNVYSLLTTAWSLLYEYPCFCRLCRSSTHCGTCCTRGRPILAVTVSSRFCHQCVRGLINLSKREGTQLSVQCATFLPNSDHVSLFICLFVVSSRFLARDSMLSALYAIARPSVRLSHGWISQKRLNVSSKFFHHLIGPTF